MKSTMPTRVTMVKIIRITASTNPQRSVKSAQRNRAVNGEKDYKTIVILSSFLVYDFFTRLGWEEGVVCIYCDSLQVKRHKKNLTFLESFNMVGCKQKFNNQGGGVKNN